MTAISKASAKAYFETGDKPTQAQFGDLIDSYQDAATNLGTLSSAGLGTVGLQILSCVTSASAQSIIGVSPASYMLISTYDAANISEQLIGVSAAQSLYNKTIYQPNIVGTTTNNNAAAGSVGQTIESNVSSGVAVSLTNAGTANVTSITLTPGDWDVHGQVQYVINGATVITVAAVGTSDTSAAFSSALGTGSFARWIGNSTGTAPGLGLATNRFTVATATTKTVYLVTNCNFTTNTLAAFGYIYARRPR